jgi:hypothetical protein
MATRLKGYPNEGWGVYRAVPTGISIQDRPPRPSRNVEKMLFRKMNFPPVFGSISNNNPPMDVFLKRKLLRENPMSMMGGKRRKARRKRKVVPQAEFMQMIGGLKLETRKRRQLRRK